MMSAMAAVPSTDVAQRFSTADDAFVGSYPDSPLLFARLGDAVVFCYLLVQESIVLG
jgi:hypothetical protein